MQNGDTTAMSLLRLSTEKGCTLSNNLYSFNLLKELDIFDFYYRLKIWKYAYRRSLCLQCMRTFTLYSQPEFSNTPLAMELYLPLFNSYLYKKKYKASSTWMCINCILKCVVLYRSGTREVHNKLEKNRRAHLKECFELLKKQVPASQDEKKTSNLSILRSAIRYIQVSSSQTFYNELTIYTVTYYTVIYSKFVVCTIYCFFFFVYIYILTGYSLQLGLAKNMHSRFLRDALYI